MHTCVEGGREGREGGREGGRKGREGREGEEGKGSEERICSQLFLPNYQCLHA